MVESVKVVESIEEPDSAQAIEILERGRTLSRSLGRRSSSVSSSTSYLSNKGLERLRGIEDRIDRFEKIFESLSKKLNKLQ